MKRRATADWSGARRPALAERLLFFELYFVQPDAFVSGVEQIQWIPTRKRLDMDDLAFEVFTCDRVHGGRVLVDHGPSKAQVCHRHPLCRPTGLVWVELLPQRPGADLAIFSKRAHDGLGLV